MSKQKGPLLKMCRVVKHATPLLLAAHKPVPSGNLEAIPQSYNGTPPTVKKSTIPIPSKSTTVTKIRKKPIKEIKYIIDDKLQDAINTKMNPLFKKYQTNQDEIQSNNPYITNTTVYTPQSRKSFYKFISNTYSKFKLLRKVKGDIDEDACSKLGSAAGDAVEAFEYQKFIREYIRNLSPYRGILVYHGLGSGKTCSAIAAAEAIYGTSNKKIIVMTPFSLRGNFISEISFCGFRHFNLNNHWVSEPLPSENGVTYMYARSVLSLSEAYLKKVLESDRKLIWIPSFTDPPNFDELEQLERDQIRAQITNMVENRIKFISYNGVTAADLKRYACENENGERMFDNAVIVIDEIHNLTRLMQGEITPYITKRKEGRRRKIGVEPIVPGKWKPGLCDVDLNYKRSYLFYKLLTDARNSKIIGLSGTPIINFPDELGVLANILAGYTECVELNLNSTNKDVIETFKKIAEAEPRVDIVRFYPRTERMEVLISVFNEGYEKVTDSDDIGVQYNPDAQDDIKTIFERIKVNLITAKIPFGTERYVSYPRLPIDDKEFKDEFINPTDLTVKNKLLLQKRLTGLISYYKGSKEEYMPKVDKDLIITCEMSDFVLSKYTIERIKEIQGEKTKEEKGDQYSIVEEFSKMKNPSSYRFRSRALCNFTFPTNITRPFPNTPADEEKEVAQPGDIAITEAPVEAEQDIKVQEDVVNIPSEIYEEKQDGGAGSDVTPDTIENQIEVAEEENNETEESEEKVESEEPEAVEAVEAEPVEAVEAPEVAEKPKSVLNVLGSIKNAATSAVESVVESVEDAIKPDNNSNKNNSNKNKNNSNKNTTESNTSSELSSEQSESNTESNTEPSLEPSESNTESNTEPSLEPSESNTEPEDEKEIAIQEEEARTLTYQERIQRAMQRLDKDKDKYLNLDVLGTYSPKIEKIIRNILISKGSNLVYSQFKTVEGLGVLGLALKANGFVEIEIEGGNFISKGDNTLKFSNNTIDSFTNRPEEKRFIFLTGEGVREKRNLILNIFNGNLDKIPESMRNILKKYEERKNKYGEICWVFGITGAGAEGISLKNCRSVHIMEPYWNQVRLDQVKGRAIRICSHQDLPFNERNVDIYTYYTVFSETQKVENKIDMTIRQKDNDETSDEKVYKVGLKKDKINQGLLEIMKESAMDCSLNSADNGISCFEVSGRPTQYIFDPNLEIDKIQTNIEYKEAKENPMDKIQSSLGEKQYSKPTTESAQVVKLRRGPTREEFIIFPKTGSGGMVFNIYDRNDDRLENILGEITKNPAASSPSEIFRGSVPIFK
jgi:hypothetical protein